VPAALAGGCLAFEGLLPDVLAFGLGHAGEEGEQGGAVPGGVVHALEGAGEECELDVVVAQVLGDGQQLGGATAEALPLVDGKDHPLVRDGLLDGAGEVHRLDELRADLGPGADLLGEDRVAPGLVQRVELALELLLRGRAARVPEPGRFRRGLRHHGLDGRVHLPRAAGAAGGGGADFELGAELGDEHEAWDVVLRGDFAAAGAAGASGGGGAGGAVELFDGAGRFGELWRVAEPIARGIVRMVFCERL